MIVWNKCDLFRECLKESLIWSVKWQRFLYKSRITLDDIKHQTGYLWASASTTSTTKSTSWITNLIGWTRKNKRAARAGCILQQFRVVLCKTTTWNYLISGSGLELDYIYICLVSMYMHTQLSLFILIFCNLGILVPLALLLNSRQNIVLLLLLIKYSTKFKVFHRSITSA